MGGNPAVAAVVDTSTLHVFLTPHDEHALHVPQRSATGFAVVAHPSSTAAERGARASDLSGTFTYRVVAKRKDVSAPRLAKFELPKQLPPPPKPPSEPKPPAPKLPVMPKS